MLPSSSQKAIISIISLSSEATFSSDFRTSKLRSDFITIVEGKKTENENYFVRVVHLEVNGFSLSHMFLLPLCW
jgi:hypothetical protein